MTQARQLKWNAAATHKYCTWRAQLDLVVGMQPLKAFAGQRMKDIAGRKIVGDSTALRHILLTGELGTGKTIAAANMCAMFLLTDGIATHSVEVPGGSGGGCGGGGCGGGGGGGGNFTPKRRHAYVFDYKDWKGGDEEKEEVLDLMLEHESISIIMGPSEEVKVLEGMLDTFKKISPWIVSLDTLTTKHLAHITYDRVREQGYRVCKSSPAVRKLEGMTLKTMEFIVHQSHNANIIRESNAYLADDMLGTMLLTNK